jgi:hypothetical protein
MTCQLPACRIESPPEGVFTVLIKEKMEKIILRGANFKYWKENVLLCLDVYRGADFNLDAVRKASLYCGCGDRRSIGRYRLPGY